MPLTPGQSLDLTRLCRGLVLAGWEKCTARKGTRLGRDVAIKILPKEMSADASRKQGFEREAKTISGSNHPNICVLYDMGSQAWTIW